MKIRVDIDISPKELREFFGLPDVEPLQQELIERVQENMRAGQEGYDPAVLLKPLLPANLAMLEQMQKAFWSNLTKTKRKDDADESS